MKNLSILIAALFCLGLNVGCSSNEKSSTSQESFAAGNEDSDVAANIVDSDVVIGIDSDEYVYQTQAEINEASGEACVYYQDSIENEFEQLLLALPQFKEEFKTEKVLWDNYQDATKGVAACGDHGSSTPLYVADVLDQGVRLLEMSFQQLLLHLKGKAHSHSKTMFSSRMIDNAYSAFVDAVSNDKYMDQKEECIKALRHEQDCWNKWIQHRDRVSKKLPNDIRTAYDECTNLTKRTKLLQLKNQNQGLGVTSGDILECVLPDGCSDKELLEYPGFDKVWAEVIN